MTLQIIGMEMVNQPPAKNGARNLAFFTANVGPFKIGGMQLVMIRHGHLRAFPPRFFDARSRMHFIDRGLAQELTRMAADVYQRMGGTLPELVWSAPAEPAKPIEDKPRPADDEGLKRMLDETMHKAGLVD